MLEVKNISLKFEALVLKNISFKIKKGQIMGLVGKSGAGKSSLLNVLAGHLTPNNGAVFLNGHKLQNPIELLVPGYETIKIVSQDYNLDPHHTVEENIREALISLGEIEKNKRLKKLMKLLKLTDISNIKAIHASGGEQQRLSIARAIALKPDILLLDEPFSNLDSQLRAKLFNHILKLRNEENMSIIIVSHDGQDVLGLSDFIYFLNNGKLSARKTPFNSYYNLKHLGNSKLFGIVNQISLNGKNLRFRPDEYEKANGINIRYENSIFLGTHYLNYFSSGPTEQIILSSPIPLEKLTSIRIKKKLTN
ncbi:ATP-binding cassette domain-containing protein [Crocinitomicaceae bacterium]|nr:ATP-binding cassette domain-containing protein [Crocinitomicaceae bacterium]